MSRSVRSRLDRAAAAVRVPPTTRPAPCLPATPGDTRLACRRPPHHVGRRRPRPRGVNPLTRPIGGPPACTRPPPTWRCARCTSTGCLPSMTACGAYRRARPRGTSPVRPDGMQPRLQPRHRLPGAVAVL